MLRLLFGIVLLMSLSTNVVRRQGSSQYYVRLSRRTSKRDYGSANSANHFAQQTLRRQNGSQGRSWISGSESSPKCVSRAFSPMSNFKMRNSAASNNLNRNGGQKKGISAKAGLELYAAARTLYGLIRDD